MGENEKEIIASWMRRHEYATGHGDTIEDLLDELKWQIAARCERAVAAEREACAKMCELIEDDEFYWGRQYADAIRARGQL
jgi:hypothetical protein